MTQRRYYRMEMDADAWPFWYLRAPSIDGERIEPEAFSSCTRFERSGVVDLEVGEPGPIVDINFADVGMIVLRTEIAQKFREIAADDCQFVPAGVHGVAEEFTILNILSETDCLDERRSHFELAHELPKKWRPIPRKYRSIYKIVIDPDRACGRSIARLKDWQVAVIVDESIATAVADLGATGAEFQHLASSSDPRVKGEVRRSR